jgi:cell division protein FtsL
MKQLLLLACAVLVGTMSIASAQAPQAQNQERLATLIKQVRDQQTELAANQTKIDEKLATLAETIRQARIYSSRTGK